MLGLDLHHLLLNFRNELHLYVIWTVGIVLALRRWQRHPQVSLLILIAFGLELTRSVFRLLAWYWFSLEWQAAGPAGADRVLVKFTSYTGSILDWRFSPGHSSLWRFFVGSTRQRRSDCLVMMGSFFPRILNRREPLRCGSRTRNCGGSAAKTFDLSTGLGACELRSKALRSQTAM
jgi:hypothetical protein